MASRGRLEKPRVGSEVEWIVGETHLCRCLCRFVITGMDELSEVERIVGGGRRGRGVREEKGGNQEEQKHVWLSVVPFGVKGALVADFGEAT